MRLMFPNGHALRDELSWTHYRLLIKVENDNAREFYMQEAVKSQIPYGEGTRLCGALEGGIPEQYRSSALW